MENILCYKRVYGDKLLEFYNKGFKQPTTREKGDNSSLHHFKVLKTPATQISADLILGSAFDAANLKTLNKYEIKTIINCSKELSNYFPNKFIYHRIPVLDTCLGNMTQYFDQVIDIYNNAEKPILIHCYMGSSRSAILTLLYLIIIKQMSYKESSELLESRRSVININILFIHQLKNWIRLNNELKQNI